MNKTLLLLFAILLTARGQSEVPEKKADVPSVEELASDLERLKALRQQCKTDRPTLGDVLCNRVVEATRKRFYGDLKPHTLRWRTRRTSDPLGRSSPSAGVGRT